ncbi:hypothetical protein BDZ94DRAFT_454330 [Collybia nuda]|uniref:Nucleolus and neural progenitor protein-like N-terminal domain-containing protein n=1 Tax=Collybia nuda TaxID=64659 RepID=A0A9P6CL87_9AGAR|nr:hypothetical protein BDZ94DRAFT_454330 [Collybia nuda]
MGHHMHRHVRIHAIDRRSRNSLDHTKHSSIDSILNDIKHCARSLRTLLKTQLDEARILERLYYKGKNQHRGALFWRHVAEMRRFCSRVDGAQIDVVLDTFYRSFFDEKFGIGSKSPKGPWTHFPDTAFVVFVLARLSACSDLLRKMHSRAMNAYQSFTLVMKSGIFLQLVLTLAAIASRLRNVSSELQHALVTATTSVQGALIIINIRLSGAHKSWLILP